MAEGFLKRPTDQYVNIINGLVIESGANTFTTGAAMDFGIGFGSGVGILIDKITYYIDPGGGTPAAVADAWRFGLAVRDDLTTMLLALGQQAIIHSCAVVPSLLITSGAAEVVFPLVFDFDPPIITVGNRGRLFPIVHSVSLSVAVTMQCRVYFRYIPLKPSDYLELAESFNLVG